MLSCSWACPQHMDPCTSMYERLYCNPKAQWLPKSAYNCHSILYESMFQVEVQVRTEEMDLIAQRGIAAHYCGKVIGHLVGDKKARSLG